MTDYKNRLESHHYYFINNVIGSYFSGMAEYFKKELYPRTTEIVISTYEKAIMHYRNRMREAGEKHIHTFPFISMNPNLDIKPEDHAGRFLYQYPAFDKNFAIDQFRPLIYQDDNITIAPVLNRYVGTIELIIWCSSVYEAIDTKVWTYQFFGGLDRPIQPKYIEGFFIMPDDIIFYTYNNRYNGETYNIDWTKTKVGTTLIKNINQQRYVFPFTINPMIKLTDISDASTKYGGDDLAEWVLNVSLEWECHIPTHLIFKVNHLPDPCCKAKFNIRTGFKYVSEKITAPETMMMTIYEDDNDSTKNKRVDLIYNAMYNYILSSSEIASINKEEDFSITIPGVNIEDVHFIKIYGKYGEMRHGFHWKLKANPPDLDSNILQLVTFNLKNVFEEGDIITIVKYVKQ